MLQESKAKRTPFQIIGLVVIFILALLIIFTFVIFGMFKDANAAPKIFGYRVYVVDNDRMETRIPKGSAVFVEEGRMPDPSKQSVILCRIDNQLWVIGFVGTQVTETGETSYLVKYDNATDDKTWGIKESDIIGVAVTQDKLVGGIIRFASSKAGIMTIVIIPCLLLIIYEVIMLLAGGRIRERESESSHKRSSSKKKSHYSSSSSSSSEHERHRHHSSEQEDESPATVRRVYPEDEDIPPEREDIKAPVDTKKEEKFVEKQLRKANESLSTTLLETTVEEDREEIKIESLNLEPEPVIRRTDILREGAATIEPLRAEAEKLSDSAKPVERKKPEPQRFEFDTEAAREIEPNTETRKAVPEQPAPTPEKAESPLSDLSRERIDELIKLLEEEKKRLGE